MQEEALTSEPTTTQERLLDAAEDLFARKAFDEVSIRELAAAADVNIAAVNYHFQGKDNLYREVIRRRFIQQRDRTLAALQEALAGGGGRPELEDVVGAMVRQYLQGTLGPAGSTFLSFMAREMHGTPGHCSEDLFREMISPVFEAFSAALLAAHPGLRRDDLIWVIASIVGQIHHFVFRWQKQLALREQGSDSIEIMHRVFPPLKLSAEEYITEVARHVTRFSSAAIEALYPEVE